MPSLPRLLASAALALGAAAPARAQRAPEPPPPPEAALVRALTRMRAADPAGAVTVLRPALDGAAGAALDAPARAALLVALADATLALGDATSARQHARDAVDADPASVDAALRLAALDAAAADAPAAHRTLADALARATTDADRLRILDADLRLALATGASRDDERALRAARALAATAGGPAALAPIMLDAELRAPLLAVLAGATPPVEAALLDGAFAAALRADPLDAETWAARARADAAAGRPERAARAARIAGRLDPARFGALATAAPAAAPSRASSAGAAPSSATPAATPAAAVPLSEARAAYAAGRFEAAAPALAAAVEATPTDAAAWRFAAMAALETGDAAAAALLLGDARLIFPGDAALHIASAYAALAARDADAARAALSDADAALADATSGAASDTPVSADPALLRRALAAARAAADGRAPAPDPALESAALAPSPGGRLAAAIRR